MAIETHSRLETQGVTGAEASELDAITSRTNIKDCLCDRFRVLCRYCNFEAILAGVASAGNVESFDVPETKWDIEVGCETEVECFEVELATRWGGVNVLLENDICKWALERDEAMVSKNLVGYFATARFIKLGDVGADILDVFVFASGIGDHVKIVRVLKRDD